MRDPTRLRRPLVAYSAAPSWADASPLCADLICDGTGSPIETPTFSTASAQSGPSSRGVTSDPFDVRRPRRGRRAIKLGRFSMSSASNSPVTL